MKDLIPDQKRLILVCCNTKEGNDPKYCGNRGGIALHAELKEYAKQQGLQKTVRVVKSGCLDYCGRGPIVCVEPAHVWMEDVQTNDVEAINKKYIDSLVQREQ